MDEKRKKRFKEICRIEPGIRALYDRAIESKAIGEDYCNLSEWFSELKPAMRKLVGWESKNEDLMGCEDYDICYDKIINVLPNCKHSGKFCFY